MAEFRLSPRARRDLDAIFDYTARHWDVSRAVRYTDAIETACATLAHAPQHAQSLMHIRSGYRRYRVERHIIYFKPTDYGIAIVRILHQRMDVARHL